VTAQQALNAALNTDPGERRRRQETIVGRRASGFVQVAQCLPIGRGLLTSSVERQCEQVRGRFRRTWRAAPIHPASAQSLDAPPQYW
jgi:hypothetical protein